MRSRDSDSLGLDSRRLGRRFSNRKRPQKEILDDDLTMAMEDDWRLVVGGEMVVGGKRENLSVMSGRAGGLSCSEVGGVLVCVACVRSGIMSCHARKDSWRVSRCAGGRGRPSSQGTSGSLSVPAAGNNTSAQQLGRREGASVPSVRTQQ